MLDILYCLLDLLRCSSDHGLWRYSWSSFARIYVHSYVSVGSFYVSDEPCLLTILVYMASCACSASGSFKMKKEGGNSLKAPCVAHIILLDLP